MSDLGIPGALDLAGIFVFAVSGALAAVQKRLDVVGMVVLAEITALGGGILRDLVIGAVPPAAFTSVSYVLVPLVATVLVFFWHPQVTRIMPAVMLFDAAGLGLFCVTGAIKALDFRLSPLHAVLLGVITAVGGGILRDMLSGQIPSVLYDRQLYALPALVGATVATLLWHEGLHGVAVSAGSALLAFGLRVAAMRWGWRTPRARGVRD
ncbi:trimeric intracellular cation channel family protein [Actinomadura rupiterrae]|uniref:trimeric intracellular cation channel family protein n=1 Tax=Actinomadura rupiterrae TaxID=559627 RepID=UPI0020A3E950|nr:trimeric intracellular cation channel family protein [Actinomadura rupiterrae]MCP2341316.1 putative membrane protein YeiH [Actinomadura rupiterrae]